VAVDGDLVTLHYDCTDMDGEVCSKRVYTNLHTYLVVHE
jgi:hypothetical protein